MQPAVQAPAIYLGSRTLSKSTLAPSVNRPAWEVAHRAPFTDKPPNNDIIVAVAGTPSFVAKLHIPWFLNCNRLLLCYPQINGQLPFYFTRAKQQQQPHTYAMQETDLHYPPQTCPFCNIAAAFPFPNRAESSPKLWTSSSSSSSSNSKSVELASCIPDDAESAPEKTSPSSFVVLRSRDVVAFLDILPMTGGECYYSPSPSPSSSLLEWRTNIAGNIQTLMRCENLGHLLVTTRQHKVKIADMGAVESREIGKFVLFLLCFGLFMGTYVANSEQGFWLPLLARTVAKVTGVTDYNIVQNNGQFVPLFPPHIKSGSSRLFCFPCRYVSHAIRFYTSTCVTQFPMSLHMLFQ